MRHQKRRDFLKKNLLGGLLSVTGIPFLSAADLGESGARAGDVLPRKTANYEDIDWNEIRKQFPLSDDLYYLNTGSLGPSPTPVIRRICDSMERLESAASTGRSGWKKVHKKFADFLNADPDEIALTRNATEGINIVARSLPLKAGDEILLTKHEHIGGSAPWIALQKDIGVTIKLVELDLSGEDNLRIIEENLSPKTKVVSFSHITATTGMRLPAKEIVALCRSRGIYSCVDGAQALGMIPLDLDEINPDFYAASGHKWLLGPKGTGILYINKSIIESISPVFAGAYTDSKFNLNALTMEYRMTAQREEYGTRNTPITMGLGAALDFISAIGIEHVEARGRELASHFRAGLGHSPNIEILTPEDLTYSGSMITLRIRGRDNLELGKQLREEKNIRIRGIYENDLNALRVSFALFNSIAEVDYLLEAMEAIDR